MKTEHEDTKVLFSGIVRCRSGPRSLRWNGGKLRLSRRVHALPILREEAVEKEATVKSGWFRCDRLQGFLQLLLFGRCEFSNRTVRSRHGGFGENGKFGCRGA